MGLIQTMKNWVGGEQKAVTSMTSVGVIGSNSNPPRRGTRELIAIYNDSPWLRAVVSKVAKGVAETHWRLFIPRNKQGKAIRHRALRTGRYEDRQRLLAGEQTKGAVHDLDSVEEVTDHPLLDALDLGNPELLGFDVFQTTQTHIDLTGEGFWVKERDALGTPVAFWPLPPDWIKELPTKDTPFYRITSGLGNTQVEIPVTEIIYFRDPNPSNPYGRGSGAGRALADEIEIDEYAAKHIKSFFHNRARPDLIVSGDNISPPDAKRLEEQWMGKHQGFWNSFKPMFFSRKIDVKTLSQTFENMQMVELRKQERDAFINVFGIPPEKLGVINESKRSTINAADFFWTKDIIKPRVELLRTFLQWKLVPDYDDRLIIDYDTPVIQDDEFKLEIMKALPWAFSIDEVRNFADEESLKDFGYQHVIPLNHELIDIASGEQMVQNLVDNPPPSESDEEEGDEEEEDDEKSLNDELLNGLTVDEVTKALVPAIKQKLKQKAASR